MVELVVVCAVAENGVIGDGNGVPWHYPEDYEQYIDRVTGNPLIVGRRTFEQMDHIDGTTPIVLSRDPPATDPPAGEYVKSVPAAIEAVSKHGECGYIIGGETIYSQFLPYAKRAYISEIPERPPGTHLFPYMGTSWSVETITDYETFSLVTYTQPSAMSAGDDAGA